VRTERGELRFRPGASRVDQRGGSWDIEGELGVLDLSNDDGHLASRTYPDALARLWSALNAPGSGDVLLSAALDYEFTDWGGADHVAGGSHGSLRRGDSLAPLVFLNCGVDATRDTGDRQQWTIADVAPVVLSHFEASA
jgi:hypothetical protein